MSAEARVMWRAGLFAPASTACLHRTHSPPSAPPCTSPRARAHLPRSTQPTCASAFRWRERRHWHRPHEPSERLHIVVLAQLGLQLLHSVLDLIARGAHLQGGLGLGGGVLWRGGVRAQREQRGAEVASATATRTGANSTASCCHSTDSKTGPRRDSCRAGAAVGASALAVVRTMARAAREAAMVLGRSAAGAETAMPGC